MVKKKRSVDNSIFPYVVSVLLLIFIIIALKYPRLILYQEVSMPSTEELSWNEDFSPPTIKGWCEEELKWVTLVQGKPASFINIGIVDDGYYEGMCHAVSDPDIMVIDFDLYFNQLGKGTLIVTEDNNQQIYSFG